MDGIQNFNTMNGADATQSSLRKSPRLRAIFVATSSVNKMPRKLAKKKRKNDQPVEQCSASCSNRLTEESQPSKVHFGKVDLYEFQLIQGFCTVPEKGILSIGMEYKHFTCDDGRGFRTYETVDDFENASKAENLLKREKRKLAMKNRPKRKKANVYSSRKKRRKHGQTLDTPIFWLDENVRYFLLKNADIPVDQQLINETKTLNEHRRDCGCSCADGICVDGNCECMISGISCHADRWEHKDDGSIVNFPCYCESKTCTNPSPRLEYRMDVIHDHFIEVTNALQWQALDGDSYPFLHKPLASKEEKDSCSNSNINEEEMFPCMNSPNVSFRSKSRRKVFKEDNEVVDSLKLTTDEEEKDDKHSEKIGKKKRNL